MVRPRISRDIRRESLVFLVGPSGYGKSTSSGVLRQETVTRGRLGSRQDITSYRMEVRSAEVGGNRFQDFKLIPTRHRRELALALEVLAAPEL